MKVQELRQLLGTADRTLLEKAFVESYKKFSKQQKEEIDQIIQMILSGEDAKEVSKKSFVSFENLEQEITDFIDNAYAQNYYAPNRVIPKQQRPKWRFMVKNYIKELCRIPLGDVNYDKSIKLLGDLYNLICKACDYYLFSTDDPFRSIGWVQSDLFEVLVKRTFESGYSREDISALLLFAAAGGLSRESLYIQQSLVLISELKTSDIKYIAVEEAKKLIDERTEKLKGLNKNQSGRYYLEESVNNLCDIILALQCLLGEPEKGVDYYFKHCFEINKEIVLYRALELMELLDMDELWIEIYKYGTAKKIKPRDSLVQAYERRVKG